ncbi:hypothetical protein C9J21_22185 [Photobacterium phosphoreum]|nr:hypothetical protein C9J21_22185 [Photobacterium phosphoreum]
MNYNIALQYINVFTFIILLVLVLMSPLKIGKNIFLILLISVIIFTILPILRTINYGDTKNYFEYYTCLLYTSDAADD